MGSYLIKLLFLVSFSFFIIKSYYFDFPFHLENFNGYIFYIISLFFCYGIYKIFQILVSSHKIIFTPFKIFSYFLLNLFILSTFYFFIIGGKISFGFILFFKIIGYMILPIFIILLSIGFGKKILSYIHSFKNESKIFDFLLSLGLGFFSFLFLLTIAGIFNILNIYNLVFIFAIFLGISYKEIYKLLKGFFEYQIEFDNHDIKSNSLMKIINPYLLQSEFLFILASFLLSVNLISIVRPFPIGWDDLGVYMNYPNLIAHSFGLSGFGGMFSWQLFTSIGYLFDSPVLAFFLNNVGGVLSFLVIVLAITDLFNRLKNNNEKTFLNLPLLMATIFISMPMFVFQQAKDMKLDAGLFFISVICIYIFLVLLIKEKKEHEINIDINDENLLNKKDNFSFIILFFVGILAGFAFSIKVTTLMLILGIIGLLFYKKGGFLAFLGYLAVFFAVFTKFGLWAKMNVVYPSDNLVLINNFSSISLFIGFSLLAFSLYKNMQNIKILFTKIIIFLFGIILALLPWVGNNIYLTYPDLSLNNILNGKSESFIIDYTKIHSQDKIYEIENRNNEYITSSSGTTSNEDLGRYFGYENGINNYVKLPWSLTMQSNQRGEYTDITYIFLALLPILFLFLPFKNRYLSFGILLLLVLELVIFKEGYLDGIFSSITLPFGYLIILSLFLLPLAYFEYFVKETPLTRLFKYTLIFGSIYVFLWTISAFGIVWYGIPMYFIALLLIAIGGYFLSKYNYETHEKKFAIKGFGSLILFFIISFYFFNSAIPHGFSNLKGSGYSEYKSSKVGVFDGLFYYHGEYLNLLYALNIDDLKKEDFLKEKIYSKELYDFIKLNNINISGIDQLLKQIENDTKYNLLLRNDAKKIRFDIYKSIANPEEKYKSKAIIYRLGTFLKYHITDNNIRLFEDSLVTEFDKYIYTGQADTTIDNMKKIGMSYIISDLNAATIDQDPRHDLTRRYENLLLTFTSNKLELIDTDSICLKIALEDYKKDGDLSKYMTFAGVNYESYLPNGTVITRGNKIINCYTYIINLINEGKIDKDNYSYLINFNNYIKENKLSTPQDIANEIQKFYNQGYKVLFKIKD